MGSLLDPIRGGTLSITVEPFSEWFHTTPGATEQPFQKYSPMWVFKPFPRKALDAIYQHMLVAPSDQSNFFSLAWGEQTLEEPKGGTAFPRSHRRAIFYSEPGAEWADPTINSKAFNWVQTLRLALEPYFEGGYVSVLDRSISNYGEQYYGHRNFARLQEIKKKWDPNNVFHFEQGIPKCKKVCRHK